MRHMLLAKGFWGHVDGTDVLADDATDQVQREFRQKGQLESMIIMAISTPQLYLVTLCDKPICVVILSVRHWQTSFF